MIEIIDRGVLFESFQFLVRDKSSGMEAGFNDREDAEIFKAAKEKAIVDAERRAHAERDL